ncbi:MAG TPA: serine--tRNA ligase [Candidatus Saccharimonadales bacterium]
MIDIQVLRDDPDRVAEKAKQKGYPVDVTQILGFDGERRKILAEVEDLRQQRNELTASNKGQKPSDDQLEKGRQLKDKLLDREHRLASIEDELNALLKKVTNMPSDDVPVGSSEEENVVVRQVGEIPTFDFEVKNHAEIAEANGWLDKVRAAKVAGSRFAYIKGPLVNLQFAIVQFVITTLGDSAVIEKLIKDNNLDLEVKPFVPVIPPALIKTDAYEATARLDAAEVTYKIEQDDLWLNASAEHSLCNMYLGETLAEQELPIRYVGYSTSFRREAGTYGKDTEGMFRMHQFDKLEMEVFSTPESGGQEHLLLIAVQEYLMQQLEIPYQVLLKCTADIGFPNARGVDIEAWLPGQNKYRETHSADYITDFQSRRMKTRLKRKNGGTNLVHTNDATALVLSRTPIAIIENYQTADGKVRIPKVLQPYMGGKEILE